MHEVKKSGAAVGTATNKKCLKGNKELTSIVFQQCKESKIVTRSAALNIKKSKEKAALVKREAKWNSESVNPFWAVPVECVITAPVIGDRTEEVSDEINEPIVEMGITEKLSSCKNVDIAVGGGFKEDTYEHIKKESCIESGSGPEAFYDAERTIKSDPDIGSMVLQHYLSPDPFLFGMEMVETDWQSLRQAYQRDGFGVKSSLNRDCVDNNRAAKEHYCPVCHVKFSSNSNLTRHMRLHTGERPFVCQVCESRFTDSSRLKEHTRIHTGEKPFTCMTCQMRFRTSSHLNRHNRVHTDKRPYSCQLCGARFGDPSKLKTHIRVHTGEKPFSCELCSARFNNSSNLNRHLHIHNKYLLLKQKMTNSDTECK